MTRRGRTLIELLMVVALLGILVGLSLKFIPACIRWANNLIPHHAEKLGVRNLPVILKKPQP